MSWGGLDEYPIVATLKFGKYHRNCDVYIIIQEVAMPTMARYKYATSWRVKINSWEFTMSR